MSSVGGSRPALDAELVEALGSSLELEEMLERVYPSIVRLVPADYGAIGISPSGLPEDFRFSVSKLPPEFFHAYAEMAEHDFVRKAVERCPNRVLRDQDMIERAELERSPFYTRARDVGMPLEHVLSVMFDVEERFRCGLALYRDRRRPFSESERLALQQIAPALGNAVRNCHRFGQVRDDRAALERLLADDGTGIVFVSPDATELHRSERATTLIERSFAANEWCARRIPEPVLQAVRRVVAGDLDRGTLSLPLSSSDATLEIRVLALPSASRPDSRLVVTLRERRHGVLLPSAWRALLTARETEVASALLRGWDNRLIASELGCAEATVKRHVGSIFDKLGVASRAALITLAAERSDQRSPHRV